MFTKFRLLIVCFGLLPLQLMHATSLLTEDSISSVSDTAFVSRRIQKRGFENFVDNVTSSRLFQIAGYGTPLIIDGLLVKGSDRHFRRLRNTYMPGFKSGYDNYLQYLPAAVMLGMKIGGVEGRSSWGRMLTSDAFSIIAMTSIVESLKHTTKIERPDGSNRHSFPSGHTATAFMTATMLSKEYGARSPWFSVGAYTVATGTGLMRMANNRHWMSDILVGAGVGIISTELGYYLADLIFKGKGLHQENLSTDYERTYKPSFLGIRFGVGAIPGDYFPQDGREIDFSYGCTAGLEGAWFMTSRWGIGGELTATDVAVIHGHKALDNSLDMVSVGSGVYMSYPLIPRLLLGGKLLAMYNHYSSFNEDGISFGEIGKWGLKTGFSLTFRARPNLGVKLFGDYAMSRLPFHTDKTFLHQFSVGSSIAVMF